MKIVRHGNKYHAKKVEIDGVKFDSQVEAKYYSAHVKGKHEHFSCHESFEIVPKFKLGKRSKRKRIYSPDFVIYDDKQNIVKVVDVKPAKITADASLRMALFEYIYQVPVIIAKLDYRSHLFIEKEF